MSYRNFFLFLILFLSVLNIYSQNVSIKGTITNGSNKDIRISVCNDLISNYERHLVEETIKSPQDTFTLKMSINYPTLVLLKIETYSHSFFVEPNHAYHITIPEFDWSSDEKISMVTNPVSLPVVFENKDRDINMLINNFDSLYSAVLSNYSYRILVKKDKKLMDTIKSMFDERYDTINNDYFIQYKKYRLASVELAVGTKSKHSFAKQYFENTPILYRNIGYMDYFNMFFESFFIEGTKYIKKEQLVNWVENRDLFKILDSLGTEPILRNEQLRELVFLKGMKDAYHKGGYNTEAITDLLKILIQQTKFAEHKIIAQGLIEQHENLAKGTKGNPIILPDVEKKMVSLDSFKGKWVYLNFVRLREQPSLRELSSMAFYHDSITSEYNLEFVTICCDREFQLMYHFLKNSKDGDKYNWTWLHFDNNYDLLEAYKVRIYPFFILIDPEGKIASYPAKSPEEGFFLSLDYIGKQSIEQKVEE